MTVADVRKWRFPEVLLTTGEGPKCRAMTQSRCRAANAKLAPRTHSGIFEAAFDLASRSLGRAA